MKKTQEWIFPAILIAVNTPITILFYAFKINYAQIYNDLLEGEPLPAITRMAFLTFWWPIIPIIVIGIMTKMKIAYKACRLFCLCCILVELILIPLTFFAYFYPLITIIDKLG